MSENDNNDNDEPTTARRLLPLAAVYVGRPLPKRNGSSAILSSAERDLFTDAVKRLVFEAGELAVRSAPPPGGAAYKSWQPPAGDDRKNDVPSPSLAYLVSGLSAVFGSRVAPAAPTPEPVAAPMMVARGPNESERRMAMAFASQPTGTSSAAAMQKTRGERLSDCLIGVFCDFLRCVHERLCTPDGLVNRDIWGEILGDCLEILVCHVLECVPDALCPPKDDAPFAPACEPDLLACDFAVETPRASAPPFRRLVRR